MAVGGRGSRSGIAWAVATCVAVGGAVAYALAGANGPLGLSDRSGLLSMAVAVPALAVALIGLQWARPGAHEDEAAAVARLVREVRSVGEPQWTHGLGGELTAIDVTFRFQPYAHARAAGLPPTPAGQLDRVIEDYRAIRPRRLVITGEPGAGKTVLARKLVMELNKARTEREPVAVLIALADWDAREDLSDWVVRHLVRDFAMPARSARKVVDAHLVLPVLDGLDEMDAADMEVEHSRARQALETLARYQDGTDPAPLVVTCRTTRYDELEADGSHILDAARIEIEPVSSARAVRFLERRGAARRPAQWQPVLDELRSAPGGVLATALSTPWRLTLTATVYEREGDPGELLAAAVSADAVAEVLLERFIGSAARNAARDAGRYRERLIHERLHRLALVLGAGSTAETDLVLHRLGDRVEGVRRWVVRAALVPPLVVAVAILMRWEESADTLVDAASTLAVVSVLAVRELRSAGPLLFNGRTLLSIFSAPPLGSPLWRLGLHRFRRAVVRMVPAYFVLVALGYSVWKALPERVGGDGRIEQLWLFLGMAALLWILGCMSQVDNTAAGPVGPVRLGWWLVVVSPLPLCFRVASGGPALGHLLAALVMVAVLVTALRDWVGYLLHRVIDPRLGTGLPAFLDWCVAAGLMRTSGIAYQFRHREFQEWLVRQPEPVPGRRP
ncbi:NACHT domain-containing protein [Streptomyces massasporeus]|uniref:NACHT domain-containing protein n=1 Tax=Streptomyces massasporeus TaxID=67324 RepID=UPI00365C7C3E